MPIFVCNGNANLCLFSLRISSNFFTNTFAFVSSRYYDNWCGGGLKYLDDQNCEKVFPTNADRDHKCPVAVLSTPPPGYQPDGALADVMVDDSLPVYDPVIKACLVVTKRVANSSAANGVTLYNKYYCNPAGAKTAYEPWSSSKIFAMANAAGHLRSEESSCPNGVYGLDGSTSGKRGATMLGDLSTIVCSYDHTAGYTSNSLSSYFHDIGFRSRINDLVHTWLGAPELSLGGNYGEATPADLSFQIQSASSSASSASSSAPTAVIKKYSKIGHDVSQIERYFRRNSTQERTTTTCPADKDPWPVIYVNSLSALAEVELTRRLAFHREINPELRFPGTTWQDIQQILYGAESSRFFPGQVWGGMTADTAIYLQSAPSLSALLTKSETNKKDFRIFSKLGAGYSSSRQVGEIVNNAHLCLPSVGDGNNGGAEFTITVEGSIPYDYDLSKVDGHVAAAMADIVEFALKL